MSVTYEHFEHGADVGVRGRGATPGEAFAGAATALFTLLAEDPETVRPAVEERVTCEADDVETLLVTFLNELIFLWGSRRLVLSGFEVTVEAGAGRARCEARVRGEAFDPARHAATVEPKGATYSLLRVAGEPPGWVAQCVVDV